MNEIENKPEETISNNELDLSITLEQFDNLPDEEALRYIEACPTCIQESLKRMASNKEALAAELAGYKQEKELQELQERYKISPDLMEFINGETPEDRNRQAQKLGTAIRPKYPSKSNIEHVETITGTFGGKHKPRRLIESSVTTAGETSAYNNYVKDKGE